MQISKGVDMNILEIKDEIASWASELDAIKEKLSTFEHKVVYAGAERIQKELTLIFEQYDDEATLRAQLSSFLKQNWSFIQGTPISYTARPRGKITGLCCEIADWIVSTTMKYLTISPTGILDTFVLRPDIANEQRLQQVVKGGYWKASILEQGTFELLSEAVSPGLIIRTWQSPNLMI